MKGCVESVGFDLVLAELVFGFQPLEIAGNPFLGNEQRQRLQVLDLGDFRFRMRQEHLRVLLKHRRDVDHRDIVGDGVERLQRVRAEEEIELTGDQQDTVVVVRAAGHDRDVEPVLLVGPVGQGLEKPALLGLRDPIGSKRDLVQRLGASGRGRHDGGQQGGR
jgi:hypothetical protein